MKPNEEQKTIVDYFVNGQSKKRILLVEAPPGTGKTFTAVSASMEYIRWNLNKDPKYNKKILILTFSKNARAQIEKQLDDLNDKMEGLSKYIEITNFHSLFQKYVWAYSNYLGIDKNISIISSKQRKALLGNKLSNIDVYNGDDVQYSWAESLLEGTVYPLTTQGNIKPSVKKMIPFTDTIKQFIIELNKKGYLGFSDLGFHFNLLLDKSPLLLKTIQNKYGLLILDEYQDASDLQDKIVNKLIGKNNNAIFFADSKQMIYEWRGASSNRLDDLKEKYKGQIKVQELITSERFKNKKDIECIINEARKEKYDNLINQSSENIKYIGVKVQEKNLYNPQVKYKMYSNLKYKLINEIPKYENRKNKSIGILCRSNEQVNYIRKALREDFKISTNLIGNNEEEHNKVNDLIEFLEKDKTMLTKDDLSQEMAKIIFTIIYDNNIGSIQRTKIDEIKFSRLKNARTEILKKISCIIVEIETKKDYIGGIVQCVSLVKNSELSINYENMSLITSILRCKDISPQKITDIFLQYQFLKSFKKLNGIYVLNVHQSKGREFDYVYIIDCESMIMEKNLLYVALSRVKEKLFIFDWVLDLEN